MKDNCFIPFVQTEVEGLIPNSLNNPFKVNTPDICKIAANELQIYITKHQANWKHNFGLEKDKDGPVKGKMFGVLVVRNAHSELGYLATFSGTMADEPHPTIFVPSLFDISTNDHFLSKGLTGITEIGNRISKLKLINDEASLLEIEKLKQERKVTSTYLQQELFNQYNFLNLAGEVKGMCAIFNDYAQKKPAAGAGECAAPKLLQYAIEHNMKPLAIAEFWWGMPTKSEDRKHGEFYPACNNKCRPILGYMLNIKN